MAWTFAVSSSCRSTSLTLLPVNSEPSLNTERDKLENKSLSPYTTEMVNTGVGEVREGITVLLPPKQAKGKK